MIWKATLFIIYFLSLVFVGLGLIQPGISQIDYTVAIGNDSKGDLHPKNFCWPDQGGINIANINGANAKIYQNINQYGLMEWNRSTYCQAIFRASSSEEDRNPDTGYVRNIYTINFFNINYESPQERKYKEPLQRQLLQGYPLSMKEVLRQLADNARILEKERKENIKILKSIAS